MKTSWDNSGRDPYEENREDHAVNEPDDEETVDDLRQLLVNAEVDAIERQDSSSIIELQNIRRAVEATIKGHEFLMRAFKRNGVLWP